MTITVRIDTARIGPNLHNATRRAKHIVTQQVLKDSNLYIPADTWNLRDSSLTHSDFENGQVIWSTPYAKKVYKGVHFNFSQDKNPRAQAFWYEKAKSVHSREWEQVAQRAVEEFL